MGSIPNATARFLTADGVSLRYTRGDVARATCAVLVLGGRGEAIEKYAEVEAELTARGYEPWALEWRGQGASGRLPELGGLGHVDDFEAYIADLLGFLRQVMSPAIAARRAEIVILAHSMGAHITLRALAAAPSSGVAKAVLVAPMMGLLTGAPLWAANAIAATNVRLGRSRRPARRERAPYGFAGNPWTRDRARFERIQALIRERPDLAATRPTWGWLRAALRSIEDGVRPGALETVRVPVLAVLPGSDRIVDNGAARRALARVPGATVVEVPAAEHELLMEVDTARARFWQAFEAFVGPKAPPPAT